MVTLTFNTLEFRFPEIHPKAECSIEFHRTLRVPDDDCEYPQPPGFGNFPLFHVEDYPETTPQVWQDRGGLFMPMYQAEALWIGFSGRNYPCAVKIAAGKINAITGEPWSNALSANPQDYIVTPGQPWLDGFSVGKGLIRQFVAMPLGGGFTAEEQITGKAEYGGLQICIYPMKREKYDELHPPQVKEDQASGGRPLFSRRSRLHDRAMGIAPGGMLRQEVYEDEYGIDAWDTDAMSRCFVHLANSEQFLSITGHIPPTKPLTAEEYAAEGLPWFDYYTGDNRALQGAKTLAGLDSVAVRMMKFGKKLFKKEKPVSPTRVVLIKQNDQIEVGRCQ